MLISVGMSRKVVLLGPLPPPHGGVSVYMSLLSEHLRSAGARVWAYTGGARAEAEHVTYFKHRRLGLVPLVMKEGRGARVLDATHFHLEHPNPLLLPAWLVLKRLARLRWYKHIHDGSLPSRWREFGPLHRLLFRLAVGAADEFVVVGPELRRWLVEEVGARQKVTVIPSLLPIPPGFIRAELSETVKRALGPYLRRAKRVCSIGVFIEPYGFLDAARAVERVRAETGEDVGLLLLDGGFARDDAYREEVLRGREWITVLEEVPNREVYAVLGRSHAFVRATSKEGYGISRVEARWCGLPVVATNVGETRGMLTYDFGDVDALAARLRRALYEPPAPSDADWAERFRLEAEAHLRALKDVLGITR
jgi:glycosyltransferase involved in cell wall biosynthesis